MMPFPGFPAPDLAGPPPMPMGGMPPPMPRPPMPPMGGPSPFAQALLRAGRMPQQAPMGMPPAPPPFKPTQPPPDPARLRQLQDAMSAFGRP